MKELGKMGDRYSGAVERRSEVGGTVAVKGHYKVTCRGRDGKVKWVEEFSNLITTEGLNHVLSIVLDGGTQITTWYLGLKNAGSAAAGDTMSSHAGWTENQNYSEGVRQTCTLGTASAGSIDNVGNEAVFSIDTDSQTIAGVFLTSNNTKGGTTGTLYSVGDFASSKAADNGDTLTVTATFTAADA